MKKYNKDHKCPKCGSSEKLLAHIPEIRPYDSDYKGDALKVTCSRCWHYDYFLPLDYKEGVSDE